MSEVTEGSEQSAEPEVAAAPEVAVEPVSDEQLLARMGEIVMAVDSVVRLEPTIRNRLRQISNAPLSTIASGSTGPDGVAVRKIGGDVDTTIEVAVRPNRPAAEVAQDIQREVRDLVRRSGRVPGAVTVSVLAVEREEARPSDDDETEE